MMDGYVLSKLETIPVQLIPEIGVQIKFHEFFKKLTGRDLDYPAVSVINLKKRLKFN
jgi:hypothetical protein